ncbi:MAG TPA: DNA-3-methyladenine glycosylase I [Thermoleophilaceae bacterium]|nr:DNA-3-methyladenine glycosylase I [Thermoleophilaceae bacterium]
MSISLIRGDDGVTRCSWGDSPEIYRAYHDTEWGFPVSDDHRLFEKLCLEGFQAGLSWLTILRKRESFRTAFAGFDFERVARFGEGDVDRLLADANIIRHRGKIEATINNARRALELVDAEGSLASYVWRFESEADGSALSKDLKRRGWRFVGPTTVYSFMEAMGLRNNHLEGCAIQPAVQQARSRFTPP